ncbi:MAG: DUF3390 domain-containing protein [Desulfobacterales bacterium]|nr:DUF3390 domain-containing protein [Desulfobacterales bacterium]
MRTPSCARPCSACAAAPASTTARSTPGSAATPTASSPGPIGKILNPQVFGLDQAGALTTASSLCGACEEVCPVKIPITGLLRRLRNEAVSPAAASAVPGHGSRRSRTERLAWAGWRYLNTHPRVNRLLNSLLGLIGNELPPAGPLERWTRFRKEPHFDRTPLHRRVKETGIKDD